ncbi:MAG: BolA family transcriptional regulator [Acidobacteria bacterium]|nr:MAG: BolA family transcriptional regulator [Acidobacteriota bacterium]
MIAPEEVRRRLEAAFPGARVKVSDMTGGGDHYQVEVVSEAFSGKSYVERHRMVYAVFGDVLGGDLHALSVSARTPDE